MPVRCYDYVAKKPFMLSVIVLNVVMLCVVAPYPLTDIVFGATTFNLTAFLCRHLVSSVIMMSVIYVMVSCFYYFKPEK
jgi:hypothetical protein